MMFYLTDRRKISKKGRQNACCYASITCIIIAYSLNAITLCDQIVVMKNNKTISVNIIRIFSVFNKKQKSYPPAVGTCETMSKKANKQHSPCFRQQQSKHCSKKVFIHLNRKSFFNTLFRLTGLEPVSVLTGRISLMPR